MLDSVTGAGEILYESKLKRWSATGINMAGLIQVTTATGMITPHWKIPVSLCGYVTQLFDTVPNLSNYVNLRYIKPSAAFEER
jgi:hypothetical protein